MNKHTPGPWEAPEHPYLIPNSDEGDVFDGGDWIIYPPLGESGPVALVRSKEDAARIVACVNACEGIADPADAILADTSQGEKPEAVAWILRCRKGCYHLLDYEPTNCPDCMADVRRVDMTDLYTSPPASREQEGIDPLLMVGLSAAIKTLDQVGYPTTAGALKELAAILSTKGGESE